MDVSMDVSIMATWLDLNYGKMNCFLDGQRLKEKEVRK
jgi:hypothetical protein